MTMLAFIVSLIIAFSWILISNNPLARRDSILNDVAIKVIKGKWDPKKEAMDNLRKIGYDDIDIQARVDKIKNNPKMLSKAYTIKRFIQSNRNILIGFICICLALTLLIAIPHHQRQNVIGEAKLACGVSQYTNTEIYYDEALNKYLVIVENNWNLFEMYSIVYIDTEVAEKVIAATEIINKFNQK